jgi:hypothetical protein
MHADSRRGGWRFRCFQQSARLAGRRPIDVESLMGVAMLVKVRPISFGLVMGVAFLLTVSLVLDTAV